MAKQTELLTMKIIYIIYNIHMGFVYFLVI